MYWRPIRETDLIKCLDVQPDCIGDQKVGRAAALNVWKSFLDSAAFLGIVIESETPVAGQKLVACGMGVFVSEEFADCEIADPQPGLNSRIVTAVAKGAPVVLNRSQIAAGNAGKGVDFVTLYGTWRDGILNPSQLAEVHALLGTSFVEHYVGYRFNRVLKEAIGPSRIALARATGTYHLIAEFPDTQSALAVLSRESAAAAPYSIASTLYRYQSPTLRLRPAEQEFLMVALNGKTDAELSGEIGVSVEAIKKRWLSIFARIDQFRPDILGESSANFDVRGPQKRHRVLAYIRSHPEELRPFSWVPKP
jgi:hypothetical protein